MTTNHSPTPLPRDSSESLSLVNPVIVCPGNLLVIFLIRELVVPQDGHEKQDDLNAVGKRWIEKYGTTSIVENFSKNKRTVSV